MATHKSAMKRDKQSKKRRARNKAVKSLLKTKVKEVLAAVDEKDGSKAKSSLKEAIVTITRTASKGVIRKNTASRKVSRLTKKVNALPA